MWPADRATGTARARGPGGPLSRHIRAPRGWPSLLSSKVDSAVKRPAPPAGGLISFPGLAQKGSPRNPREYCTIHPPTALSHARPAALWPASCMALRRPLNFSERRQLSSSGREALLSVIPKSQECCQDEMRQNLCKYAPKIEAILVIVLSTAVLHQSGECLGRKSKCDALK